MRRALTLLLLAACSSTDAPRPLASRDSAGIRIVENIAPGSEAKPVATLTPEPVLVLGKLDGPEPEQFGMVTDVRRLGDGTIIVADARNRELRLFEADGSYRRAIGQRGEGPGDMQGPRRLLAAGGDTLLLFDWTLLRVTAFDTIGLVRALRAVDRGPTTESNGIRSTAMPEVIARHADDQLLAMTAAPRVNPTPGQYLNERVYWHVDTLGHLDSLTTLFASHSWVYDFPGRSTWSDSTAFAPRASNAFDLSRWLRAEGAAFEYRELSADLVPLRIVRTARQRAPVTAADRSRIRMMEVDGADADNRDDLEEIFAWMTYPDSMPAYDQLAIDALGHAWARVFPDTATTATWDLFAPDGTLLGTVAVPADLTIRQIGDDWLLATRKGELDEPLVVLYRLTRHR